MAETASFAGDRLAAALGGALWGLVPGWLKAKFNVHEVVCTIMMNWIAYWSVYYIVPAYFKGAYLETEVAADSRGRFVKSGLVDPNIQGFLH